MKDIDEALSKQTICPLRPLRDDFTSAIIADLKANPNPKQHRKWHMFRVLKKKIDILSLGLLLIAGSAAAAVTTLKTVSAPKQNPAPNVNQAIVKQLADGNRIVGYNLQDCHFFSDPTYVDTRPNENVFYEVKQGSTLTNEQIEDSLEGVCESSVNSDNIAAITKVLQDEGVTPYDEFSTMNMLVENITPTSITVRIDPAYNPAIIAEQDKIGLTYKQFFQGLKVYDENTPIAYSAIKAGDTVQLLMGHTAGYTYMEGIAQEATPSQDILYAIMKVPPLAADPTLFYLSVGQDLQRVKPCSVDSSGYCPIYGQQNLDN